MLPSSLEAELLRLAREGAVTGGGDTFSVNFLHADNHPDAHGGFILFSDAIIEDLRNGAPTGLKDGGFDSPGVPDWNQFGSVDVTSGAAVLSEGDLLFSDVSQVFSIPAGTLSLSFDVSGVSLNTNGKQPPDAFEVALLDAIDIIPLVKLDGLSNTDALLSLQADGTLYLAPGVTVTGDVSSGSFSVSISLAGAQAGTPMALFFDLIRFGTAESMVTIDNVSMNTASVTDPVAPVVDAGADTGQVNEGDTFTRSGTFSDANGAGTFTATVDYGDGTGPQPLLLSGGGFSLSRNYVQNGIYTILVSITDPTGLVGTSSIVLSVENVAPVVNAGDDRSVQIGSAVSVNASFTDPGLEDSHTASIDWGDGSVETVAVNALNKTLAGSHNYTATGTYSVTVTVTDSDAAVGSDTFTVTVIQTAPVVSVSGPGSVNEGESYTLQLIATGTSASQITGWVIDWGDGSDVQMISGRPTSAQHVFLRGPNTHTIRAKALIGATEFVADTLAVQVNNIVPAFQDFDIDAEIIEGEFATLTGSFADSGDGDNHTIQIDWGDGVVESIALPQGDRSFSFTHQYLNNRPGELPYVVRVTLGDDAGASTTRSASVIVRNLAPQIVVIGPQSVRLGQQVRFDASVVHSSVDQQVSITWAYGDGRIEQFTNIGETGALQQAFSYQQPGAFTVVVTAEDEEGAVGEFQLQVIVFEELDPTDPDVPGVPGDRDPLPESRGTRQPSPQGITPFDPRAGLGSWLEFPGRWMVLTISPRESHINLWLEPLDDWTAPVLSLGSMPAAVAPLARVADAWLAWTETKDGFPMLEVVIVFEGSLVADLDPAALVLLDAEGNPVEGMLVVDFVPPTDESGEIQQARWQLRLPENLPEGWQLRLNVEGVLDMYGRPLDGDENGVPGGDWVMEPL